MNTDTTVNARAPRAPKHFTPICVGLGVALAVGAYGAGFYTGRRSAPVTETAATTETGTKVEWRTVHAKKQDKKKTKVTRTVKHPDGTEVTDSTTVTETKTNTDTTSTGNQASESKSTTKTVTRPQEAPRWTLTAMAGIHTPSLLAGQPPQMVYGGALQYRLVGPLQVGAWGLSSGTVGVSAGVTW